MIHAAPCNRGIRACCRLFVLAAGLAVGSERAAAQEADSARQELQLGVEAAARGDTTAALARLDRALQLEPHLAEAHFQRGLIFASQASHRSLEFDKRLYAQQAFEAAIRADPGNPRYFLELGKLMLKQQIRHDAKRVFERALETAARADGATLAETHFNIGVMYELQWQRLHDRQLLPLGRSQFDVDNARFDAGYVWRMLTNREGDSGNEGMLERDAMLEHFRAAIAADPAHRGAHAHILAYLYDKGLMEEFHEQSRRFLRSAPRDPVAHLAAGLGYHRAARSEEAAAAFRTALGLLPPEDRLEIENIGRILSREEEAKLAALTIDQKQEYQRRFWALADPLHLTAANEFWLEYMARMAYVDVRFALPEYNLRGWQTDRGVIYVRYGEPVRKGTFAPTAYNRGDPEVGQVTTVWTYGEPGPVFVFRQNPGFRRARFAGDFAFYADSYRSMRAATLASGLVADRLPLPLQVARFRGADNGVDIEVHAAIPYEELGRRAGVASGEIESGLFVQDESATEHTRLTRSEEVVFARGAASRRVESWRTVVPADRKLLVAVEARDPLTWAAATARVEVQPVSYPAGALGVSDLLLAHLVEPQTAEPRARSDFRIDVNPSLTYTAGQPISMYFEIYNLLPDAEQYASYDVQLTVIVKEIYRTGAALRQLLGDLADKWGLTPEGGEAIRLRFNKDARVLARDIVPEHLRIQIPEPPPGRYALRVLVRDRNANREYQVEREFEIGGPR